MIEQLKRAFELAEQRPVKEQEALAALLLEEMRVEEHWDTLFADWRSSMLLDQMVRQALSEDNAGDTEEISGDTFL